MLEIFASLALAGESTYTNVGGAPYQVVQRPSLVSIYQALENVEPDTLHVRSLDERDAYQRCGGTGKARVLIMNHGIPMSVWAPPGAPSGFIEVYADMDGNGQPDPEPYKALDPLRQSGFVATWRAGDDLQVIFLRDSGKVLEISGLPLQTLWRKPTRRDNPASGVIGCDMDPLEGSGGHKGIIASSLSRMW